MDVSLDLVVVTHDSAGWLEGLVETWGVAAERAGLGEAGVMIADAGSEDETVAVAGRLLPGARVLALKNVGFGAAANRGMGEASAAWVLLCNADVTFPAEFGVRVAAAMEGAAAGVACMAPQLLNADGTAQASVGVFPSLGSVLRDQWRARERRKYVMPQPAGAGPIDWATGACLLLRREAFLAVGGFDEKYFLYVEEVDLQRRLRAAGHEVWFVPEVTVTHHQPNAGRGLRPEIQRYAARGMLRYFAKFGGGLAGYRVAAFLRGRLGAGEAFASRRRILECATGP